jgi:hypothetical protein
VDVDNDNRNDIIVGTQAGHSTGHLMWFKSKGGNPVTFNPPVSKDASGVITALNKADYGSDGIDDIIVGWRDTDLTFGGGVEIWYTTTKTLPNSGQDATGGKITNWVTGIEVGDFNYGVWPSKPNGPFFPDIAGVARKDSKNGRVFTLIR